jgi:hypothetical protein
MIRLIEHGVVYELRRRPSGRARGAGPGGLRRFGSDATRTSGACALLQHRADRPDRAHARCNLPKFVQVRLMTINPADNLRTNDRGAHVLISDVSPSPAVSLWS